MNESDRLELSRLMISLLEDWGADARQTIALLALPSTTKPRLLKHYRENTALPDTAETNERIEHLVGIAEALRTSFPLTQAAAGLWMRRAQRQFGNRTPLATMVEDGLRGVMAVRAHLDCAWDWHESGSQRAT